MFRILPGVRPVETPAEREARRRMEQRRTALGDEIAQWRLVPADERNQVDGWDSARAMVIFHMYNHNVRRYLYRAHITDPEEMDARLVRDPNITGWGQKLGENSEVIAPEFWLEFFTFVRLQDWNIDEVKERVVLKRDFLTLEPIQHRPERDTSDFVRFYRGLWSWISVRKRHCFQCTPSAPKLLRDIVLLYFVRCCLLHKNGRAVLDLDHFDWMGENGRNAVWKFMELNDPRQEETRLDDRDYLKRVAPLQESWDNLLRMFSFGLARRYTLCDKGNGVVCAVPDVVEGMPTSGAEEVPPPVVPRSDLEQGEGGTPPPVVPRSDLEGEETTPTPPEVPARVVDEEYAAQAFAAEEIGAEQCPLHDLLQAKGDHMCPAKCMPKGGSAQVHPSRWMEDLRRCNSHIAAPKLQQAAILLAVGAEQPSATRALLEHHGAPTRVMRGHTTATEWSTAMRAFEDSPPLSAHAMEAVDALARYGGWAHASQAERLARYATVYGAGNRRDQAWVSSGWTMSAPVARRLRKWCDTNPKPPHRTLQALAAALQ